MRKVFFLIGFILTGCSMYKAPDVPKLETPEVFKINIENDNEHLENTWWENFNDEQLNELVEHALEKNYNYLIALNNIDIALTYVEQNKSGLFPQINSTASFSRNKYVFDEFFSAVPTTPINPGYPLASDASSASSSSSAESLASGFLDVNLISLFASYELDVWNRIRNSVKQAQSNVVVSTAESNIIKLTLISSVVNTYFQIMALNANIDNLNKQILAIEEIKELTKVQVASGLVNEVTLYNAKIQKESALILIKAIQKQKQMMEHTLAYLLSEYPENFDMEPKDSLDHLAFEQLIPEGIPSQMLIQRPDIQSAYFQVVSYGYLEKQALANFFPSFTLTGLFGYANPDLGHLIGKPSEFWSYGLNVSQYVFDYALRQSEYDRAGEQFESSILSYQDTVVNAFTEVNNALVSYQEDNQALKRYLQQREHYQQLVAIADAQYQAGLMNYTNYLTNELNLLQTQYNITNQQLLVTQDVIQVYKALGLGLEEDNGG